MQRGSLIHSMFRIAVTLTLVGVSIESVRAASIPGVFNTGVDGSGNPVADSSVDLHYQLATAPAGFGPQAYVVDSSKFPLSTSTWLANTANAKWIAPQADQSNFNAEGDYVYRTSFDLTGFTLSTVQLNGKWATDNAGIDILINGNSTGISHVNSGGVDSFKYFSTFQISSNFVAGVNTLDFLLHNDAGSGNPTGLIVELSGTGSLTSTIPEPSGFVLAGTAAIASLTLFRRRRRSTICA